MSRREKCFDRKANAECLSIYNGMCLMLSPCHNRLVYAGKDRIKCAPRYGYVKEATDEEA